jgi:hypothetical protein
MLSTRPWPGALLATQRLALDAAAREVNNKGLRLAKRRKESGHQLDERRDTKSTLRLEVGTAHRHAEVKTMQIDNQASVVYLVRFVQGRTGGRCPPLNGRLL